MHFSTWNVDASQILSRQELAAGFRPWKQGQLSFESASATLEI